MLRRGGGRRGGGDFCRKPQSDAPSSGRRGGGGGRGRRGRGRGGGGGGRGGYGEGNAPPPPRRDHYAPPPEAAYYPPPPPQEECKRLVDHPPSSATATASSSSLSQDMDRQLSIRDQVESEKSGSASPQPPTAYSKALGHPPWPGFGTVGRRCIVEANHFLVEVVDNDLCHYDVAINPESTSRTTNRNIISKLIRLHKDSQLGRRMPVYDGRKSLYTAGVLPFTSKVFVINLPHNGGNGNVRGEKEYKVAIKGRLISTISNSSYVGGTWMLHKKLSKFSMWF